NAIDSIASANIDIGGTNYPVSVLTLDAAAVDLAAGDVVRVFSEDPIPQSAFLTRMLGEFAIVYEVDGLTVRLNGLLRDTYTTTPRVARLDQKRVVIKGFTFEIAAAIDTGSGSGAGADAPVRIRAGVNPEVSDVRIGRTVSNAVVFQSCFGYLARNIEARDLPDEAN